jgi:hypothetical protein
MTYEAGERPAFLQRMIGQQQAEEQDDRPTIHSRYGEDDEPRSDEEGDEAPQVVVLNSNRHLSKEEAESSTS